MNWIAQDRSSMVDEFQWKFQWISKYWRVAKKQCRVSVWYKLGRIRVHRFNITFQLTTVIDNYTTTSFHRKVSRNNFHSLYDAGFTVKRCLLLCVYCIVLCCPFDRWHDWKTVRQNNYNAELTAVSDNISDRRRTISSNTDVDCFRGCRTCTRLTGHLF